MFRLHFRRVDCVASLTLACLTAMFDAQWLAIGYAQDASPEFVTEFIDHAVSSADSSSAWTIDRSALKGDLQNLPIGVFDSGIGGLTVLEAILAMDAFNNDTLVPRPDGRPDFEQEQFIYLGDQANMPYGNYASAGKEFFLRELILKDAAFLLGRRYWPTASANRPRLDKPPVKAIVIACNTATAYGLEDVRSAVKSWKLPIPVIGVVESGAQGVLEPDVATGTDPGCIAVLATVGTCSSMAYPNSIKKTFGLAGRRLPQIIQHGSVGLAGAIEGDPSFVDANGTNARYLGPAPGNPAARIRSDLLSVYRFDGQGMLDSNADGLPEQLKSVNNYVRFDVASLMSAYRESGGGPPIDTIVLGCTHFPLVEGDITKALGDLRNLEDSGEHPYRELLAEEVRIVNPAELLAKELFRTLARAGIRRTELLPATTQRCQFFISVPAVDCPQLRLAQDGGLEPSYKYGRQTGLLSIEDTRVVPMTVAQVPRNSLQLIQKALPEVWEGIQVVAPVHETVE